MRGEGGNACMRYSSPPRKRQDKADINDSGELARNEVVKVYSKAGNETT